MHDEAQKFLELFKGNEFAHGRFTIELARSDGSVKQPAVSKPVRKKVSELDMIDHFRGSRGVQIVPVTAKGVSYFGVVDCDDYGINPTPTLLTIARDNLPCITTRSKSGGLRIFMFFESEVSSQLLRSRLLDLVTYLGLRECEVFPKQAQIMSEHGEVGSHIALPYFGAATGETTTYAYKLDGSAMTLTEFINRAYDIRITQDRLEDLDLTPKVILHEGPPCLNSLCHLTVTDSRNIFFFNLCIYLKKAQPELWKTKAVEYNHKFCSPALSEEEVNSTIRSIAKRQYSYQCSLHPLKSHCVSAKCRRRKFGLGSGDGVLIGASVCKVLTEPALWLISLDEGTRLVITTEELINQRRFQSALLEKHSIVMKMVKQGEWEDIIADWLSNAEEIEAPKSASSASMLRTYFLDFLTNAPSRTNFDELSNGYIIEVGHIRVFRIVDFLRYLEQRRFTEIKKNKLLYMLKEMGVVERKYTSRGIHEQALEYTLAPTIVVDNHNDVKAETDETPF